jgi:O-antigen/teichoic acid export membrane protein
MIGVFLTQSHVAAYEVAWRVSGMVMLLSYSISITIFPQISEWDVNDQREKIARLIPKSVTGSLLLVFPAIVGAALLDTEILLYLFGEEYTIANLVLVVLLVSKVPDAVNAVLGRVLLGMDRPDLLARAVGAFMVLNMVLNVVLIQYFGLIGAAVATGGSFLVNATLTAYYLRQLVPIRFDYPDLAVIAGAALAMGAVLYLSRQVIPVTSLVSLVLLVAGGGIVYFPLLLGSRDIRQRVLTVVRSLPQ